MTDTDLITAGESTNADKQSESVTKHTSEVNTVVPGGSLSTMVLPELRALANRAGVKGTSGMRKNELIAAIQEITGQANGASSASTSSKDPGQPEPTAAAKATAAEAAPAEGRDDSGETQRRERRKASREAGTSPGAAESAGEAAAADDAAATDEDDKGRRAQAGAKADERKDKTDERDESGGEQQSSGGQQSRGEEDGEGRQGRRGRRFRDRRRRGERSGDGAETEVREDDVLQPVAGILDVLDNYAFVRTSGYLAGPHDVYVSMNMVRKNGLRRGDAVTGAVRVPREGEAGDKNPRQKFNPLVRLDSVNGGSVEDAKKRPDFSKLTPLYPNQRLRLETTTERLTTRVIDLIMPIGKGQRALIVSPPKAGKTTILQDIANAITKNNPECHLMVVLVDERPEEVTDMTRSVKGEVIASTFDRPPSDHTSVAELAIERAKRLVEQGKDVVVLLDSITRLGRAYNNASPASGRILSGGVDSTALYPPKRFLGAARNIEEGGSLTIIATAMVETGSTGDTVIFEEFKGTGNAELKLDRKISERRVFPAVDVNPSGTRKDELLLSPDEFAIVHKLRRVLSGLDAHQAIDLLMSQLRKTKNNYEFLVQVSKTTPGNMDND
ncbi:transcription termination factor Rho [Mycobacterium kansasii]|uniref:Transcription termination factor Rho n=1 Tax=Mycobacterium attenuatum TaxID=2341086 RepID=A0A498Q7D6_9MYCO|nr:transcription termination factor Rho [Mycobacterium attenuatum]ORB83383.1 transcription termination factor Rho [Mycobacterium kansasii]VBA41211.1 Transcription termination factor Rho [Mycobacterium attenuatum]VBA57172.1 Transcription termination factor Rho [Mycobacterium attenuatum]VBA60479.1 Transcription termination factor Rho [Mycobacterium attenuatum]